MTKSIGASAALAALLALTAPALAQAPAPRNTTSVPSAAAPGDQRSETVRPDQIRANKFIGATVYDSQNQKIGPVQDIVLDKDGRVADVIVDVGGFLGIGGKNVAVKYSDIKTDNNRLTLNRTKDQLRQAANFQLEDRTTGAGTSASPVTGGRLGTGTGSSGSSAPPR